MKLILVASREDKAISAIKSVLDFECQVDVVGDKETCFEQFSEKHHELIFLDLSLLAPADQSTESINFCEVFTPFWKAFPMAQIIVMSSSTAIRKVVAAVKSGAADYLTYPLKPEEVRLVIDNVLESRKRDTELEYLREKFWKAGARDKIYTLNPEMKNVFGKVSAVAPTKTTVLLTGETGTGKGVIAKLLHLQSSRSDKQFIAVHCGSIPDTLIESELFGHEKGSFTGAIRKKLGKFEIAQGGTLFLDEIGTVTRSVQIKLLQVLQDRIFQRVGGEVDIKSDVRIIAASNEDLQRLIDESRFRKDLYYRLNVFPIRIPPLRERIEDMPFLIKNYLEELNKINIKNIQNVHPTVMNALRQYDWPGNIRELENIIERAYIMETSSVLTPESFTDEIIHGRKHEMQPPVDTSLTLHEIREAAVEGAEKRYLREQLAAHKGRMDETAAACGIGTRQLHKLLKKYDMSKNDFKFRKKRTDKESEH